MDVVDVVGILSVTGGVLDAAATCVLGSLGEAERHSSHRRREGGEINLTRAVVDGGSRAPMGLGRSPSPARRVGVLHLAEGEGGVQSPTELLIAPSVGEEAPPLARPEGYYLEASTPHNGERGIERLGGGSRTPGNPVEPEEGLVGEGGEGMATSQPLTHPGNAVPKSLFDKIEIWRRARGDSSLHSSMGCSAKEGIGGGFELEEEGYGTQPSEGESDDSTEGMGNLVNSLRRQPPQINTGKGKQVEEVPTSHQFIAPPSATHRPSTPSLAAGVGCVGLPAATVATGIDLGVPPNYDLTPHPCRIPTPTTVILNQSSFENPILSRINPPIEGLFSEILKRTSSAPPPLRLTGIPKGTIVNHEDLRSAVLISGSPALNPGPPILNSGPRTLEPSKGSGAPVGMEDAPRMRRAPPTDPATWNGQPAMEPAHAVRPHESPQAPSSPAATSNQEFLGGDLFVIDRLPATVQDTEASVEDDVESWQMSEEEAIAPLAKGFNERWQPPPNLSDKNESKSVIELLDSPCSSLDGTWCGGLEADAGVTEVFDIEVGPHLKKRPRKVPAEGKVPLIIRVEKTLARPMEAPQVMPLRQRSLSETSHHTHHSSGSRPISPQPRLADVEEVDDEAEYSVAFEELLASIRPKGLCTNAGRASTRDPLEHSDTKALVYWYSEELEWRDPRSVYRVSHVSRYSDNHGGVMARFHTRDGISLWIPSLWRTAQVALPRPLDLRTVDIGMEGRNRRLVLESWSYDETKTHDAHLEIRDFRALQLTMRGGASGLRPWANFDSACCVCRKS